MKNYPCRFGNVDWKGQLLMGSLFFNLLVLPSNALDYFWGLGTNGVWSDQNRWGPLNHVPSGNANTVEIFTNTAAGHAGGPFYGVTLDGDYLIGGFSNISPTANFLATGRTFTVEGPTSFDGYQITFNTSDYVSNGVFTHTSGHFDLVDSDLTGTSFYDKNGGTTNLTNYNILVPGSQSAGTMTILGTSTTFSGGFDNIGTGIINLDNNTDHSFTNGDFLTTGTFDLLAGNNTNIISSSTNHSFINGFNGVANINAGGAGARIFTCNTNNAGTLNLDKKTDFPKSSGTHINSGTINATGQLYLTSGKSYHNTATAHLNSTGGNFYFLGNNLATSSFTNDGVFTIENGATVFRFFEKTNTGLIDLNNGTASFTTGYFTTPQPFTNSGDIDVAPGATVSFYREGTSGAGQLTLAPSSTIDGGGQININININNTTTDLQGNWNPGQSPLALNTSSLNGVGSLTTSDGVPFISTSSNLGATVSNHGDASFVSTSTSNGAFNFGLPRSNTKKLTVSPRPWRLGS